jgi:hypothetical protein
VVLNDDEDLQEKEGADAYMQFEQCVLDSVVAEEHLPH